MPIFVPRRHPFACIAALTVALTACGEREAETTESATPQPLSAATAAPEPHQPTPTTTPDGLTLTDLAPGQGEPVPPDATVTIEFTAWIAGEPEPFDSTERRRRSLSFSLENTALIAGLRRGVVGMATGGTRRIEIPATLAYGTTGRHPIPPDADLVYEVTLIEWQPATN